jgi:hypothetical protein
MRGTASIVQAVTASGNAGRLRWLRSAAVSTRKKAMQSSRKIASVTKGLKSATK